MTVSDKYDDIIELEHHVSDSRPHMTAHDRAAQFSPFAALTGFDDAVQESGRLTARRIEPDDEAKEELDEKLRLIMEKQNEHPTVTAVFFLADAKKEGGGYESAEGSVKLVDERERALVFENGISLPIDDIISLSGSVFPKKKADNGKKR